MSICVHRCVLAGWRILSLGVFPFSTPKLDMIVGMLMCWYVCEVPLCVSLEPLFLLFVIDSASTGSALCLLVLRSMRMTLVFSIAAADVYPMHVVDAPFPQNLRDVLVPEFSCEGEWVSARHCLSRVVPLGSAGGVGDSPAVHSIP